MNELDELRRRWDSYRNGIPWEPEGNEIHAGSEPWWPDLDECRLDVETLLQAIGEREYVRPDLQWFALEMEKKLRANDHKGHWRDCSMEYLRTRLHEELGELLTALDAKPPASEQIAKEAADVANFCMMIADAYRERAEVGRVDVGVRVERPSIGFAKLFNMFGFGFTLELSNVKLPNPQCPGADCMMCSGETCALCGAGTRTRHPDDPRCEHDVAERHHGS